MSFKVAPGVRIRASSRGLSAGIGPRAARVHVGSRGVGVSSGVGPVSGYAHLGGGSRRTSGGARRTSSAPTKASVAAYERELKAAQKEADIDKVATLEKALISVHQQSFPKAARVELPATDPVDAAPIKASLEADAGIPGLAAAVGGNDAPPQAAEPEPVDRYELMRDHRKRGRQAIPFWRIRKQIDAARKADQEADVEAGVEAARRVAARQVEQARLDSLWAELEQARSTVADQLTFKVAAEMQRREAERATEQAELDADWTKLQANDPGVTLVALEAAFADNESGRSNRLRWQPDHRGDADGAA